MKLAKEIFDKMLDLTNELSKEAKAGNEYLAVRDIELAIGVARSIFEQRLNDKDRPE